LYPKGKGRLLKAIALYTTVVVPEQAQYYKLNDIEPRASLCHVLSCIADHLIKRIDELLPWCVAEHLCDLSQRANPTGRTQVLYNMPRPWDDYARVTR